MRDPIVSFREVHLILGAGAARVHILKGIDLEVAAGESLGLIGPSGSGKSSLLLTMVGLERPSSGDIRLLGRCLSDMSEDELARFRGQHIGIVFQSFHLMSNMTALENVAVPLELAGVSDAFERAAAELAAVGLSERLTHYPSALSGGEQQRVAIARALVSEPGILIADEPTGNLDVETGRQIVDLVFAAQRARNMTMVLVTHDTQLAARCDRVVRMRSGELFARASATPA